MNLLDFFFNFFWCFVLRFDKKHCYNSSNQHTDSTDNNVINCHFSKNIGDNWSTENPVDDLRNNDEEIENPNVILPHRIEYRGTTQ